MATVTRENIGLLNDKITVKIEKTDFLPAFEKALKSYGKQANIPGFRKGMVPTGVIKKMFGQNVYTDTVLKSVEQELGAYLQKEKLEIFAQPLPVAANDQVVLDVQAPTDYDFAFEVGLKPAFQVAAPTSANLKRYKIAVTDDMVEEELARLQSRNGNMTSPETADSEEHVLNVTFAEADAQGQLVEGGIQKDNSLLVKYFAPAFRNLLLGKKVGDSVLLQLDAAFDEKERTWILSDLGLDKAGADALGKHFLLTITKVGLVEKAALDATFFSTVYPNQEIADVDTFKAALRADIQAYYDSQSTNQAYDQLYHYLLEKTQIDFPEGFLKRWMEVGGESPKSTEDVAKEYPSFQNSLKWTLIIDQLVKEHQIDVKPEEIKEMAKSQLFSYMGNMGAPLDMNQPWVNDYVEKMTKDRKFVEDAFHRIQTDKVFAAVNALATGTETPISVADFTKLQEEHQHHH
jgi:trigger factor